MSTRSRTRSAAALAVIALWLTVGCYGGPTAADGDPAADRVSVVVHPQISDLYIDKMSLSVRPRPAGVVSEWEASEDDEAEPIPGALFVAAWPADPRHEFSPGARLPLTVRTSRGEAEELSLRGPGELCGNRVDVACHKFRLVLRSLDDAYRLLPELKSISARFIRMGIRESSVTATVVVLDGDLEDAMRTARQWSGVREVKLLIVYHLADAYGGRRWFDGGLPVEFGAPVPDDGRLQFEGGDTITVEYRQLDGNVLTTSVTP